MNYAQGFGLNLGSYANNYGSSLGNLASYGNNYGSSLGNLGSYGSIGNLGSNLGSNAVSKATKLGNIIGKYGGITLQGISTGLQVYSAINQAQANEKMIELADKQLQSAKDQYEEEKNRYNAREKERLDANKQVAQSASLYDNPMTRT